MTVITKAKIAPVNGPAAAIRGYIVRLREERGVTQEELAPVVGLKRRAYVDWETGATEDLKAAAMCAAFRYLRGSFDHLRDLSRPGTTRADGERMAEVRLREETAEGLNALRDTIGQDEFADYLLETEAEAVNQAQVLGKLRDLLKRRAR